ncbi:cholesterol oxidase [Actinomycetospora sp. NBRC 106375]|uniref:GMC family oxidoreductase N-terminal domain-containing protein n=1 Tax=Actinomycetospora sp. NBRC 106375 TaxID=3032207 RepID=UPI0024A2A10D|nr:GMC family oxidoreductase [Actinomycetospora sp. NBRC 106375]GLZ44699.1 cholesterol oxidase [Actinomycetospora sp. NBRC 106375]
MILPRPDDQDPDYDVLVVGSGFGGSVTALRLTEKGYRVGVLEAGRRFADHEFPATSWQLRDYLWAPWVRCFGIFRATPLRDVLVLSGAGVGGGSLVYANTLYRPPPAFYDDPQWAGVTDWADELDAPYDQAARMLGATTYPRVSPSDAVMRDVAEEMGVGHTYRAADVGVFFGAAPGDEVPDPFFGGAGPARHGCLHCGECMTGCRHDVKNTLVKNYLHLAEAAGARVHPMTTVTRIRPHDGDGSGASGYDVEVRRTGRPGGRRTLRAQQVVVAASALGSQRLLHRLRRAGDLPRISARLGELSRTNSEAILAARTEAPGADYTRGVSITSSIHPDAHTHVEPVRYGRGSNLLALLSAVLVDGTTAPGDATLGVRGPSWRRIAGEVLRSRTTLRALHRPRRWAEQSIVLLVMQTLDNSLTLTPRRFLGGLRSRPGDGTPNPAWIPAGHEVARRVARRMRGFPVGASSTLVNLPVTGHFLGGAVISETADTGVVDPYHRLHGHPGVHVVDGSTVPANLGVNPSLTITALAERAMSLWPNRGEPDPRPAPGAGYRRVAPVAPHHPAVPADAPGGLRIDLPTPTIGVPT